MKTGICVRKMHSKWLTVGNEYEILKELPNEVVVAINGTAKNYPSYGFVIKADAQEQSRKQLSADSPRTIKEVDHVAQVNKAISERIEALHSSMLSGNDDFTKIYGDIDTLLKVRKELS